MQENHSAFFIDVEKHARDAILRQGAPNFVNTFTHRPADWHPDRPSKFHRLDILSNPFSVLDRQSL
jgi:hypothetical protein